MRTTLTIDDDILSAARELANVERRSIGEIVSSLARKALRTGSSEVRTTHGIPMLPNRHDAPPVTSEMVKQLADELL